MNDVVVRYKVKEGRGDENQRLVEAVFAELEGTRPPGLRYGTFRLADGTTFVHIARIEEGTVNPLTESPAFAAFQANLQERCDEQPAPSAAALVAQYELLT